MAIAICSECGSHIEYEIGEEFAYCPICECDQVEIKKNYTHNLSEELNQIYSHLGVEAFPNQQEEALKIIDNFNKKVNRLNDIKYKYSKLQEKYENLEGWHESVLQESLQFENELEIYKKALKLACFDIYNLSRWENSQEEVIEDSIKFYINKAKEIIESNNQLKIIEKEQLKDE